MGWPVAAGGTTTLTAVVKDKTGQVLSGPAITWSISPTSIATIAGRERRGTGRLYCHEPNHQRNPGALGSLGLVFLQGTHVPIAYRSGALVALHGSWDRSVKTGYKVIWVPWGPTLPLTGVTLTDLVAGGTDGSSDWGRPVGVVVEAAGAIYLTDDA